MKKIFLKIAVMSAMCSVLWASAQAQPEPQTGPSGRTLGTKRMSATGRATDHPMLRASNLVGAQVNDSSHERTGQIQDIIVNPNTGKIDFALLSTNTAGSIAPDKLVPVPWSLLKTSDSSEYAWTSEHPVFILSVDQSKLTNAPTMQGADLNQSGWRQRVYSFYGLTPESSAGRAESPEGTMQGRKQKEVPPPAPE